MAPPPAYRIHPAIGIARLGDSPDEFCISPEGPAQLPIDCDAKGNPYKGNKRVTKFKDSKGRIKRQAARFHIYVYDDDHPEGRALKVGDSIEGGGNQGKLVDIQWRVQLANKKAAWYTFDGLRGEVGYPDDTPLRNPTITDEGAREKRALRCVRSTACGPGSMISFWRAPSSVMVGLRSGVSSG